MEYWYTKTKEGKTSPRLLMIKFYKKYWKRFGVSSKQQGHNHMILFERTAIIFGVCISYTAYQFYDNE